jgi:hypothetical protein
MALEGAPRSIRFAVRIGVQHDRAMSKVLGDRHEDELVPRATNGWPRL